jgi:hypothetical protein
MDGAGFSLLNVGVLVFLSLLAGGASYLMMIRDGIAKLVAQNEAADEAEKTLGIRVNAGEIPTEPMEIERLRQLQRRWDARADSEEGEELEPKP